MTDLINRQDAIDVLRIGEELLKRVLDDMDVVGQDREKYSWGLGLIKSYISDIEELQPAESVRHGKWIRHTDTRFGEMLNDILICSECNVAFSTVSMIRRSYCPNCGARMDAK